MIRYIKALHQTDIFVFFSPFSKGVKMAIFSCFWAFFQKALKWLEASELPQRRRIGTFNLSKTFLAMSSCTNLLPGSDHIWISSSRSINFLTVADPNSSGMRILRQKTTPVQQNGSPLGQTSFRVLLIYEIQWISSSRPENPLTWSWTNIPPNSDQF